MGQDTRGGGIYKAARQGWLSPCLLSADLPGGCVVRVGAEARVF